MKNKNWRSVGWCETHEKQMYPSVKVAKKVRRMHHGEHKVAYPCTEHDGKFHIGGLPQDVITGRRDRSQIRSS